MSGWNIAFLHSITLGDFRANTKDLPDDYLIQVPALSAPDTMLQADNMFVDPRDKTIDLTADLGASGEVTHSTCYRVDETSPGRVMSDKASGAAIKLLVSRPKITKEDPSND